MQIISFVLLPLFQLRVLFDVMLKIQVPEDIPLYWLSGDWVSIAVD